MKIKQVLTRGPDPVYKLHHRPLLLPITTAFVVVIRARRQIITEGILLQHHERMW